MRRSSFLSSTSFGLLALAGCPSPSPTCGTGGLTASTLAATGGAEQVAYGALQASENNDCPGPGAPTGVISVTIVAAQTSPAGTSTLTFCLPRPDLVASSGDATLALGSDLELVDVGRTEGTCHWHDARDITGSAHITGFCGADDTDGFALALVGTVTATVTESCDGQPDADVSVTLSGSAPGSPMAQTGS